MTARPPEPDRAFTSPAVEAAIQNIGDQIGDPDLRRLFEQCLPNTLDTAVRFQPDRDGHPDTYIVTGDIPALWLRDSAAQMWPYLRFMGADANLRNLVAGLIRRQAASVATDPYANAFNGDTPPRVHEQKWEPDSLAAFFRLSHAYFVATHDTSPFTDDWFTAVRAALLTLQHEQAPLNHATSAALYHFAPDGHPHPAVRLAGYGYPGAGVGLVRGVFRPSDDEAVFPYNIPVNAALVVSLRGLRTVLDAAGHADLAATARDLADTIDRAIADHGLVDHPRFGRIYAYEVDGFGSRCLMDDPNIPSLLSLPYLGYIGADNPVYQATRAFVLSTANPFYASGKVASGLTSPHVGVVSHLWPLATITQALTSTDPAEISGCLDLLKATHAGTFFMHESLNINDPSDYTRPWFAWANSLFGELILKLAETQPDVLRAKH